MVKKERKGTTNLDLTGKRFGKLVVLKDLDERVHGNVMWECLCDCGVKTTVRGGSLTSGNTNSCGCLKSTIRKGNKYGMLTTVRREKEVDKWKWLCNCDCGNETWVLSGNLIQDNTRSCGCLKPINEDLTETERKQKRNYLSKPGEISYGTWRRYVKRRDNNTCVICQYEGKEPYDMVAHHLDGFDWCEERRVDVDNGVMTCNSCHTEFHHIYNTTNNTEEQFKRFFKMKTNTEFVQKVFNKKDIMKY